MMVKAWHFVGSRLRDGSLVPPDGKTLVHKGPLVVCKTGFHASERLIDALQYAPGSTICRVVVDKDIIRDRDKLVARKRTILWRVDGEDLLRQFARNCALECVDKWDPPKVVLEYLNTGDPTLRWAARSAAEGVTESAAWSAAWSAARSAAWSAARSAARSAAWSAAWSAAESVQNKNLTKMVNAARRYKS